MKSHPPLRDKKVNLGGTQVPCHLMGPQIYDQVGESISGDIVGGSEGPSTSPVEIKPPQKVNLLWGNGDNSRKGPQVGGPDDNRMKNLDKDLREYFGFEEGDRDDWEHNQQQQRQQQRQPQQTPTTDKYLHSGFMLLDKQGKVQKYLNGPDDQLQQDQILRKRDLWSDKRRVSDETLKRAEKKMWEGLRDSEYNPNTDKKYGQKGIYKKAKVKSKEMLEDKSRPSLITLCQRALRYVRIS